MSRIKPHKSLKKYGAAMLIASFFFIVSFWLLSRPSDNSYAQSYFLFDNIFTSQLVTIALLTITLSIKSEKKMLRKRLMTTFIFGCLLAVLGWSVGNHGPRVITEADHPASIRYLCVLYGDDVPVLQGSHLGCFLKNSVTSASNPARILVNDERRSQAITFVLFESGLLLSYLASKRAFRLDG